MVKMFTKFIMKKVGFWLYVISFACVVSVLFGSCNSSKNEIDAQHRSGVVLIVNQYYYTLTLPDIGMFFVALDDNGDFINIEDNPDSARNCMVFATGTGFFISDDGKIATNKHVVSRSVSDKNASRLGKKILTSLERYFENQIDTCEAIKTMCRIEYSHNTDAAERAQIAHIFDLMNEKIEECNQILRELKHIDPEEARLEYHSDLKVAYNDTYVRSEDDMFPCVLRDTSDKDVAIIQLNSKQTPADKYVFLVPQKNMLEHYSFGEYLSRLVGSDKNDKLFMIGFNRGFGMAATEEGINSQCTEGSINQMQKDIIQYNISSEPGSSGSPILNRRGQLVAVNFAGYRDAKNFNYGLKAKFLYDLMVEE